MPASREPQPAPLCRALGVRFALAPGLPQAPLDFDVRPGLTLLLGGERSGKTTVLRWLAGHEQPAGGRLLRRAVPVCWPDPLDAAQSALVAEEWLSQARHRWPAWRADVAAAALDALALTDHLGKTLAMLSAGTRRKLGLVEAVASDAELTLLDGPFAALDMPSCRWLVDVLGTAARASTRAWVVADYDWPPGLAEDPRIAVVDLGEGTG